MIVTGASLASSAAAIELAREHPGTLFATAGVHPHHAAQLSAADLPQLRELLAQPQVVAAGECGLDYYRDLSPRDAQLRAFEWQLQLAADSGKPVFLHQRDAHAGFRRDAARASARTLPAAWRIASPAAQRELEDYLALDCRSASPAGCATSAAVRTCRRWWHAFRPSGCCSRPMRRTCCRGT